MPPSPFRASGGSLPPNDPTYVERPADQEFYTALKQGEYCYVLNSRQMGKSSLRSRTQHRLEQEGVACATLDLSGDIDTEITPNTWYYTLATLLGRQLGLLPEFDLWAWWLAQAPLKTHTRFSHFIRDVLLERITTPIVIFIDEIDTVLSLKKVKRDDFFALIRACYNHRADDAAYQRLTVVLLGVATPVDLIDDRDRTPFNIGRSLQLTGFSREDAHPLADGLAGAIANPQPVLAEILRWTGGQPFLTQKLCDAVVQTVARSQPAPPALPEPLPTVDDGMIAQLVQQHITEQWESKDEPPHLRTIQDRILGQEQRANRLLGLYREILQQGSIAYDGSPSQVDLRLSGLVVERQNRLEAYNPIYRQVFDESWVAQAFTKMRPYAAAIEAWEASGRTSKAYLLKGEALDEALTWAEDRTLGRIDYQFLVESQKSGLRRVEFTLDEVSKQLVKKQSEFEALQTQVGTLEQLSARITNLSRQLELTNYELKKIANQKLGLQQELDTVTQVLAATNNEVTDRTRHLEDVTRGLQHFERTLVRNQRRTGWLVGLGATVLGLSLVGAGIATQSARVATAQERRSNEAAQEAKVDRRLSIIPRVGDSLGVVGRQLEKKGLETQRNELKRQNTDLEAANQQASQQVETAAAASRDALARLDQVNGQLGDVQDNWTAITTELSTKTDELVAKNQELGDLNGEVTQLETEKDDLEQAQVQITQALQQTIGTLGIQRVRNVYYVLGGFDNALDYLNGSLEQAKTIQDRRGEGYANGNLGTMYATLGQYPQALAHHEAHLKIAEEVQDRQGTLQATGNLGKVFYDQGQYQKALPQLEQYLTLAQTSQDKLEESQALAYLGRTYLAQGQTDQALSYQEQSLEMAKAIQDKLGESEIWSYKGDVYFAQANYPKALECYDEQLKIAEKIKDKLGIETARRNKAKVYRVIGPLDSSIAEYEASLEVAQEIDNRQGQAAALGGLGEIYQATYVHGQALETIPV